jgi:hypothetical protein
MQLTLSDAKGDLFTANPREKLLTTLFHYGTDNSRACKARAALRDGRNPYAKAMKKGPAGPFVELQPRSGADQ